MAEKIKTDVDGLLLVLIIKKKIFERFSKTELLFILLTKNVEMQRMKKVPVRLGSDK